MNTSGSDRPAWFSWSKFSLQDSHRLQAVAILVNHDERWLRFLFDLRHPGLREGSTALLSEIRELSRGEQCLVRAAIDLWSGQGEFRLVEALDTWDEENLVCFIRAICHLKEIGIPVMHGLIDDQNGGSCI